MACAITITSVAGVGSPLASVHVTGTATPGGCSSVKVTLQCSSGATATLVVPVDASGNWVADFTALDTLACVCGKGFIVRAECSDTPECAPAVAKGELQCPPPGCPTAVVAVVQLDCAPDGRRTVRLDATIGGVPPIVTQWDFGDGTIGVANAALAYSVLHDYATPGPYTATLNVVLPTGCPPAAAVPVGPLDRCESVCPEVAVAVSVVGCAGGASSATATLTATLSPPLAGCAFHWDFGDGTTAVTAVPVVTHSYGSAGTFAASVAVVCGATCVTPMGVTVEVSPCCPLLDTLSASVNGCADETTGDTAMVTWVATTDPPASPGTFFWNYADGVSATTTAPTHARLYTSAGAQAVTVTYTPATSGCPQTILSDSVAVPACGDGDDDDDGGGSSACGVSAILIAVLAALTLGAVIIGAVVTLCLGLALPGWYWAVVAGFAAAVGLMVLLTYIFCWIGWCPCLTACDWLKIAWIAALAAAVIALYFGGCCGGWWWAVILGLVASAGLALKAWVDRCSPSRCAVVLSTVVALATVAGTLFGFIATLGPLTAAIVACAWLWVKVGAAALAGLLAAWAAANCTSGP